jgi:hypothetical protein
MDGSLARKAAGRVAGCQQPARCDIGSGKTLFLDFNTLVIDHGLDPMTVHRPRVAQDRRVSIQVPLHDPA